MEELVSERMKRCGSKLVLEESKVDFAKLLALQDENRALREMNAKWIEQLAAMDQVHFFLGIFSSRLTLFFMGSLMYVTGKTYPSLT